MVTKIKEVRAEPHDSSRYMLQEELTEVDIRNVTIFVSYLFPRSPISALAERWYIKCKMENIPLIEKDDGNDKDKTVYSSDAYTQLLALVAVVIDTISLSTPIMPPAAFLYHKIPLSSCPKAPSTHSRSLAIHNPNSFSFILVAKKPLNLPVADSEPFFPTQSFLYSPRLHLVRRRMQEGLSVARPLSTPFPGW